MISKICLTALTIGLVSGVIVPIPSTLAQSQNGFNRSSAKPIVFKPPKDRAPKNTNGAATRDGKTCLSDSSQTGKLTVPILPRSHYGLTLSSRPEFLVYKTKTTAKQMLFSLRSEDGEQVYQAFLPLPAETGVVSINMPGDAPELAANKKYKWTMAIICGKALRPDSPTIEGWIQYMPKSPALSAKLQASTPFDRIVLYGENGIWYDMVSDLNKLRRASPENQSLTKVWEQLLQDNGLQAIEPISLLKKGY
jgi:Domain of Unknown Function (DUF928)